MNDLIFIFIKELNVINMRDYLTVFCVQWVCLSFWKEWSSLPGALEAGLAGKVVCLAASG